MTDIPYARTPDQAEPGNPLVLALLAVFFYMVVVTLIVAVSVFAVKDQLRAEPPHLPWTFFVVNIFGAWLYTVVQFAILYFWKPDGFWPQGRKQWLQRLSPTAALLPAAFAMVIFTPANLVIGLGGFLIMLSQIAMMVPVILCLGCWFQRNKMRLAETVRLRAVAASDLPRAVRTYFETHTNELNRLGFEQLGDYRLKQYSVSYARFFLNRENDTFAEISYAKFMVLPLRAVCFFSLAPDGQYLESSNARWGTNRKTRYFEMLLLPHVVTGDVFRQHQDRLRELDKGQARRFVEADLEPVIHYGLKHLYKLMIADEVVGENPYANFDESVLVQTAVAPGDPGADVFDTAS